MHDLSSSRAEAGEIIQAELRKSRTKNQEPRSMNRIPNTEDIELSERYDQEDDVYYVTVKTGEPSLVMEHDDRILFEMGIFTGMPTGFRILNFTKNKETVAGFKNVFKAICKKAGLRKLTEFKVRQERIDRFFEKVTA